MAALIVLRIPLDEHRFQNVGRLPDGTQFMAFVTGAFPVGQKYYSGGDWRQQKRWIAVIHRFDSEGHHLGTEARLAGFDIDGREVWSKKADEHLEGDVRGTNQK